MTNPRRKSNVVTEAVGDGLGVFDPQLQQPYVLNATSALVFQHCDGQTTPQQLTELLRQKFNVPQRQAEELLWLALGELEKANLLQEKITTTQAPRPMITRRQALTAFAAAGLSLALLPLVSPVKIAYAYPPPATTTTEPPATTTTTTTAPPTTTTTTTTAPPTTTTTTTTAPPTTTTTTTTAPPTTTTTTTTAPPTTTTTTTTAPPTTTTTTTTAPPVFPFTGFFPPVDNPPTVNQAKAGSSIPVKFSLGGNLGLNILAAGYPVSQQIACNNSAPISAIEETTTANQGLTYSGGQYNYVWKTQKSWAGTCRQFILRLTDGTNHVAIFSFK